MISQLKHVRQTDWIFLTDTKFCRSVDCELHRHRWVIRKTRRFLEDFIFTVRLILIFHLDSFISKRRPNHCLSILRIFLSIKLLIKLLIKFLGKNLLKFFFDIWSTLKIIVTIWFLAEILIVNSCLKNSLKS